MEVLKKGEYINCHDKKGLVRKLKELDVAGYGAVRTSPYNGFWIMITSVPKEAGGAGESDG